MIQELKSKIIHFQTLSDKLSISISDLVNMVISNANFFKSYKFVDGVFTNLYYNKMWYIEVCDTKYQRGKYIQQTEIDNYSIQHQKPDQHMSVFWHDSIWKKNVDKTNQVSCKNSYVYAPYIYLELDRENLEKTVSEIYKILINIEYIHDIKIFYSGNRGYHVAIPSYLFGHPIYKQELGCGYRKFFYNLAGIITKDSRHENGIIYSHELSAVETLKAWYNLTKEAGDIKKIKKYQQLLENFDPHIYSLNSLIRLPNSIHEKTGKFKIDVTNDLDNIDLYHTIKPKPFYHTQQHTPYLLEWSILASEERPAPPKPKSIMYDSSIYKKFYKEVYGDDIDICPNDKGWINNLYSLFDETDINPSCGVNLQTGAYNDFGDIDGSLTFSQVISKYFNISMEETDIFIKERYI